jgi:glycerol-3-phosphate acyltransferase PlsY
MAGEWPTMFWLANMAGLVMAYLLGSLPTGYLAGRLIKDVDIRKQGSGSTGATNVLRICGPWPALAVFLIDVLKGTAAIVLIRWLYTFPFMATSTAGNPQMWLPWAVCASGLAALLGHSCSIWLNFKGGKSIATGLGVVLAMSWPVAFTGLAVFAVVLAAFRMVSFGSMLAALTAMIMICWMDQPWPYRLLVIAGGSYVIVRHRANISRLLAGTEPRLSRSSLRSTTE